jgi:hypothetical protein
MSHDRNIKYLIDKRIIYRRFPVNDKPTDIYDWGYYYQDGTYECYELFRSKAKINTYKIANKHTSTTDPSYNKSSAIKNGQIYKIKL